MVVVLAFIKSLFGGAIAFVVAAFQAKVAVRLAWLAAVVGLTAALVVAVEAVTTSIARAMPSDLLVVASWVVPDNFAVCLGAYYAVRTLIWVYDWKVNATTRLLAS